MRLSGHISSHSSIIDTDALSLCVIMSQVDKTPTVLVLSFSMAYLLMTVTMSTAVSCISSYIKAPDGQKMRLV